MKTHHAPRSSVKTLGILGGMGPLASADFYTTVTQLTPAARDADHLPIILWSDPRFPDRNAAIFGTGPSPRDAMIHAARQLVLSGANYIAMPCNTAHAWWAELAAALPGVPVLHIVDAALSRLQRVAPNARKVGLLATVGTLKAGIYVQRAIAQNQPLEWLTPTEEQQSDVMAGIAAVKAADLERGSALLAAACQQLIDQGAQAVIAACTEVPIALRTRSFAVPVIDSTAALAQAAVHFGLSATNPSVSHGAQVA
jgi:aspartate racemase